MPKAERFRAEACGLTIHGNTPGVRVTGPQASARERRKELVAAAARIEAFDAWREARRASSLPARKTRKPGYDSAPTLPQPFPALDALHAAALDFFEARREIEWELAALERSTLSIHVRKAIR
ncbi:MAG: hypothetical protein ACRENK_16365 [Gemmatimonadaceae bacterium]